MFYRQRIEFPHLSLLDRDENVIGVVQLVPIPVGSKRIYRRGPYGHPRWPQWWTLFRTIRFWHLEPRDEDMALLDAHIGDAALTFTGHGLRIGQMTLALPPHINVIEIDGRNGDTRA